jgi:hypothetical protein
VGCWSGHGGLFGCVSKEFEGVDVGMEMNACKIQHFDLSLAEIVNLNKI